MSRKRKSNSKIQDIFNQGKKLVTRSFVAFFSFKQQECSITIIASKKIGNAVKRNRSRRRLKELARQQVALKAFKNISLILIARNETSILEFTSVKKDFDYLIKKIVNGDKNEQG